MTRIDDYDDTTEDEDQLHHLHHVSTSTKLSYTNPPELVKSSSNQRNTFLQGSTHLQDEMDALEVLELTVKQHQQELMGEKELLTIGKIKYNKNVLKNYAFYEIVSIQFFSIS
jgi:hypothetical protein